MLLGFVFVADRDLHAGRHRARRAAAAWRAGEGAVTPGARGPRIAQGLRRPSRRRNDVSLHRDAGRAPPDHRPQRRGQDDAVQPDHRRPRAVTRGSIRLFGREVSRMKPHQRAHCGLARTYQIITLFREGHAASTTWCSRCSACRARAGARSARSPAHTVAIGEARRVLALVGLEGEAGQRVAEVSYGDRRRARDRDGARADAAAAAAGRAARRAFARGAQAVRELIGAIPRETTVVMIEHDMDTALELAERITLLHFGQVIVEGTRAEVVARSHDAGGLPWRLTRSRSRASTPTTATATCCTTCRSRSGQVACWRCSGATAPGRRPAWARSSGWLAPRRGDVRLFGEPIAGLGPEAIARRGVGLVPQGRRVFPTLTVRENLRSRGGARRARRAGGRSSA